MKTTALKGILMLIIICTQLSCSKDYVLESNMEETFYVRNGGSDMPVFVRGNGESNKILLLLHGGPGDTSVSYLNSAYSQQLHTHYAVAYYDQRQQGNSHGHFDQEENSLSQIVEDTHDVVKALQYRYGGDIEIYLWGHSWGGAVGTAYLQTADYQSEISGFIEVSGGYDFDFINQAVISKLTDQAEIELTQGNHIEFWKEVVDYIADLDVNNLTTEQSLDLNRYAGQIERDELIDDLYVIPSTEGFSEVNDKVTNPLSVTFNAISIFTQEYLIDELLSISLSENLNLITVPTLLIWGEYDFKVPVELGQFAYDNIGSVEKTFHIYPHAGHTTMRYDADRFFNDVREFLE